MKTSRRARRMKRYHSRLVRGRGLNLVSLMDVFTILVFFLLVNTSDVQELPSSRDLELPESTAEQPTRENMVVMLTRDRILVNGRPVIDHESALAGDSDTIPALAEAMTESAPKTGEASAREVSLGRGEVTIMADKGLPYRLIRKVMLTSTRAEFANISLAVLREGQG